MGITEYLQQRDLDYRELPRFLNDSSAYALTLLEPKALLEEKHFKQFKKALASYANGKNGPFGDARLDLYCEAQDLIRAISEEYARKGAVKRSYKLDKSFIGTDEGFLMLLKAIHQEKTEEELMRDFCCSRNTIQNKRSALADGIRIGDMAITTQIEYGGAFESSVHPILLPLNLSEVYALVSQLKTDALSLDEKDPRAVILDDLADKIHFQLSAYAKEKIDDRLKEDPRIRFYDSPPVFYGDDGEHAKWMKFEKLGARVCVTTKDGTTIEGIMSSALRKRAEAGNNEQPERRLVLRDGEKRRSVAWSDVVSIEAAERID